MTKPKIDEAQIREAAYLLWLDEGQPQGRDQEHWHKAFDMLTPTQAKAKPGRKAPSKPRVAKAKPIRRPNEIDVLGCSKIAERAFDPIIACGID